MLAGSVLNLGHTVTNAATSPDQIAEPLRAAIGDLAAAGSALADDKQAATAAHAASAHRHTSTFQPAAATQLLLAAVIDRCAGELQQLAAGTPR